MKRIFPILLLLAGLVLVVTPLTTAHEEHEAPPEMAQYFLGLIYKGETWTPEATPEVMEIQKGHLANIKRLVKAGQMVLAGPLGDAGDLRGLFVYDVGTIEEARELVATDPAVQSGRLRVELYPWWGTSALKGLTGGEESHE